MRPLTLLQRQRITLSLFFTVAVGAVFTVAAPAFVSWQVVDEKRAQALDQQRRQGKDFHVLESHSRRHSSSSSSSSPPSAASSTHGDGDIGSQSRMTPSPASPAPISSQGPIISLLTERSKLGTAAGAFSMDSADATGSDQQQQRHQEQDPQNASSGSIKKRRRRRKRKMVNEGWQELTGRTAREEKERHLQEQISTPQPSSNHDRQHTQPTSLFDSAPVIGENGGIEISWKNKAPPASTSLSPSP